MLAAAALHIFPFDDSVCELVVVKRGTYIHSAMIVS